MSKDDKQSNTLKINKFFTVFSTVLFCTTLILGGILFFSLPKKKFSELERRNLSEFPKFSFESLASGEFTDKLSLYVSDNFIFRDIFVQQNFALEENRGFRPDGIKIYSSSKTQNSPSNVPITNTLDNPVQNSDTETSSVVLQEEVLSQNIPEVQISDPSEYADLTKADLEGEKRGALFTIGDTALEIFYGNKNVASDYTQTINSVRNILPQDVRIFDMTVPTHFEFGLPSKYKGSYGREQKPFIDEIYTNLDAGITKVDAYSEILKNYNQGKYLYFRTDHHWTALGAYYAYVAFAKSAGFEPVPIEEYETKRIDKFLGTFYSSTYDSKLLSNPDFVEYYLPFTEYSMTNYKSDGVSTYKGTVIYQNIRSDSGGYLAFLGGDIPLSVIQTNNQTGKSIIVLKESYGNAFVPFLLPHYDTIYVADIRTFPFNLTDYVVEKNITDVLFCNNIMTACSAARVINIMNLLN